MLRRTEPRRPTPTTRATCRATSRSWTPGWARRGGWVPAAPRRRLDPRVPTGGDPRRRPGRDADGGGGRRCRAVLRRGWPAARRVVASAAAARTAATGSSSSAASARLGLRRLLPRSRREPAVRRGRAWACDAAVAAGVRAAVGAVGEALRAPRSCRRAARHRPRGAPEGAVAEAIGAIDATPASPVLSHRCPGGVDASDRRGARRGGPRQQSSSLSSRREIGRACCPASRTPATWSSSPTSGSRASRPSRRRR